MKTFLLIIFSFITSVVVSQTIILKSDMSEQEIKHYTKLELDAYKLQQKRGYTILLSGAAIGGLGVIIKQPYDINSGRYSTGVGLSILGSLVGVMGVANLISSQNHLRNAQFIMSGNGAGIVIKLN
jgi:hypothetical protein